MKKQLFMYLFLFAALYIVFQYMNAKKAYVQLETLEKKVQTLKEENKKLATKTLKPAYFSLEDNDAATTYFGKQSIRVDELADKIEYEIIGKNQADEDNELVPFDGMVGPMRINHIKILNHKWIIADFTDGAYWGELLLKYKVDADGEIDFENIEAFLYPEKR